MGLECLAILFPLLLVAFSVLSKPYVCFLFYGVIRAVNILCLHQYKKAEKTNTLVYHSVVYFLT